MVGFWGCPWGGAGLRGLAGGRLSCWFLGPHFALAFRLAVVRPGGGRERGGVRVFFLTLLLRGLVGNGCLLPPLLILECLFKFGYIGPGLQQHRLVLCDDSFVFGGLHRRRDERLQARLLVGKGAFEVAVVALAGCLVVFLKLSSTEVCSLSKAWQVVFIRRPLGIWSCLV